MSAAAAANATNVSTVLTNRKKREKDPTKLPPEKKMKIADMTVAQRTEYYYKRLQNTAGFITKTGDLKGPIDAKQTTHHWKHGGWISKCNGMHILAYTSETVGTDVDRSVITQSFWNNGGSQVINERDSDQKTPFEVGSDAFKYNIIQCIVKDWQNTKSLPVGSWWWYTNSDEYNPYCGSLPFLLNVINNRVKIGRTQKYYRASLYINDEKLWTAIFISLPNCAFNMDPLNKLYSSLIGLVKRNDTILHSLEKILCSEYRRRYQNEIHTFRTSFKMDPLCTADLWELVIDYMFDKKNTNTFDLDWE